MQRIMVRLFGIIACFVAIMPTLAQADLGDVADRVANKVENAATKAGDKVGGVAAKAQGGVVRASDKIDGKAQPVQDKLAQNEYVLTRHSELRASPSPRARVHGTFKAGAKVVVDDWSDDGRWGHVRIRHDGKVLEGWVPKASLKKVD